jgi:hypothetical protein
MVIRVIRGRQVFGAKISEKRMNRTYELMFIVRPDMTEEADLDKLIAMLAGRLCRRRAAKYSEGRQDGQAPSGLHRAQASTTAFMF